MKDIKAALIQTPLIWEDIAANLTMLDRKIDLIDADIDLIILPETFSTGFSMAMPVAEAMDGSAMKWLRQKAIDKKCVIAGSLIISEDGKYYNRLIWMRPDGSYETYDKRHLFSLSAEAEIFTAGDRRMIVTLNGWKICPLICYDLRFPVWSRNWLDEQGAASYDLLIYVANWPQRRQHAWQSLLTARAIENQCYVLGVNRVGEDGLGYAHAGESCVIDPLGEVHYRSLHEEITIIAEMKYDEVQKARASLPFLKDGDRFSLIL